MATKKLEAAIAADDVKVKSVITGEIKIEVEGKELCLCHGQIIDITKRLKNAGKKSRDALSISGLAAHVKKKHLVLL